MKQWHFMFVIGLAMVLGSGVPGAVAGYELLVTSRNSNNVLRYDGVTGQFMDEFIAAGSGGLKSPGGMALGTDGLVYVASHNLGQASILRYDARTGAFMDVFTTAQPHAPYIDLRFAADGNLYASSEDGASNVQRFEGHTGAFLGDFLLGGSNRGIGIAFDTDGDLYVSNYLSDSIDLYDGVTGAFKRPFVANASAYGLGLSTGMIFDAEGELYVCGWNSKAIYQFDGTTGQFIKTFVTPGSGGLQAPAQAVFGPDGSLYVSDFGGNQVLRYDGRTGGFLGVFGSGGGLARPVDMVFIPEPVGLLLMGGMGLIALRRIRTRKHYMREARA